MDMKTGGASEAEAVALRVGFGEFVTLIALMMALTALSIDIMLPALPQIAETFALSNPNDRQAIITSYLLGFACGQLIYGPASDRFGRKPALAAGLALFLCGALAASLAPDVRLLLAARIAQGLGGAAPRVISLAIVRDLFHGRQMARVMSFAMMVFILAPVFAPSVGQGVLQLGPWRWNFYLLTLIGAIIMAWSALRLPETRHGDRRRPRDPGSWNPGSRDPGRPRLIEAVRMTLGSPQTMGYALASAFMLGCLMSYIGSAQQVFVDVFGLGADFPLAFGAVASVMALSSFVNTRLVMRLGMRRVSHSALTGFISASLALTLLASTGQPALLTFCVLLALALFMFGLIVANFNTIAMEPLGQVAGTAASVVGFVSTSMAAIIGGAVGRLFDGSVLPLSAGFTVLGAAALVTVLRVEGARGMFVGE
jgi:DHA1 family bicyclomycin/chloramphenicol resistance-like MFS transporter